jgi:hypothetical protein
VRGDSSGQSSAAATVAAALEQFAVHVDDVSRTRWVQAKRRSWSVFSSLARAKWAGFGSSRSNPPPHGIELPHQLGITVPSFGRSDLLDPVTSPKTTHTAKRRNAAFCAHPRPGENEDAVGRGNCEHGGKRSALAGLWVVFRVRRIYRAQPLFPSSDGWTRCPHPCTGPGFQFVVFSFDTSSYMLVFRYAAVSEF